MECCCKYCHLSFAFLSKEREGRFSINIVTHYKEQGRTLRQFTYNNAHWHTTTRHDAQYRSYWRTMSYINAFWCTIALSMSHPLASLPNLKASPKIWSLNFRFHIEAPKRKLPLEIPILNLKRNKEEGRKGAELKDDRTDWQTVTVVTNEWLEVVSNH